MGTSLKIALVAVSAVIVIGLVGTIAGDGISMAPAGAMPTQLSYTNLPTWSWPGTHLQPLSPKKQKPSPTSEICLTNQPEMAFDTTPLKSRSALAPGAYVSKPYSMIVVAPGDADSQMTMASRTNTTIPMPTVSPETHFEKIAP